MSTTSRVTLVLPKELWDRVKRITPHGERSRLVAEAIRSELRRAERLEQLEQLRNFQKYMRNKYGEFPSSAGDIDSMRVQRDEEISGLR
ncbi:MAG: hypothetical protein JXA78_01540 [Anaerolineales bacterium]|nr:hypothetical protein [Anaerolineales bacterium]